MKVNKIKYIIIFAILISHASFRAQTVPQSSDDFVGRSTTVEQSLKMINGETIKYFVKSEDIILKNDDNENIGSIFSFSYLKKDANKNRPVTFIFNGDPGSSSLWLHMGLSPKKVIMDNDINPSQIPPFNYGDNSSSIIDCTDLVFVDPIGTGFSRIIGKGKPEDFYGVEQDAESLAQFVELWLIKHNRWNSPKYLIGESYGSGRVAILAKTLTGGPLSSGKLRGISINGIVMLGTDLGYVKPTHNLETEINNYVSALPTFAATAWYHKKAGLNLTLKDFYKEAKQFADTEYKEILKEVLNDNEIAKNTRLRIIEKLTYFTGLNSSFFENQLYISKDKFATNIIPKLQIGFYDSRYTLKYIPKTANDPVADDPAMSQYSPLFIENFNRYIRNDLAVSVEEPYKTIDWKNINMKWDYKRKNLPDTYKFVDDLNEVMASNKNINILVASGYYDLATTGSAAYNDVHSSYIDKARTIFKLYESGHMLYIGKTQDEFCKDIRTLITNSRRQ